MIFHFVYFSSFLLLISQMKGVVWRGWTTSLPVCVVLSDAEGRSVVDERRTETADRVARYQADY